jgi:hypothetical protein
VSTNIEIMWEAAVKSLALLELKTQVCTNPRRQFAGDLCNGVREVSPSVMHVPRWRQL